MSKMKGHITNTATGTTRGFASPPTASGNTAKSIPQNVLPTSPMKTRAGGQFHIRNPSDAAPKAAATAPIAIAPEIHAAAAIVMMTMLAGHMYMGSIGMRGALDAMRTGYVDEAWAKEHHELWYDDVKAGKIPAQRSKTGPATPLQTPAEA